jgi:hypothetical protein
MLINYISLLRQRSRRIAGWIEENCEDNTPLFFIKFNPAIQQAGLERDISRPLRLGGPIGRRNVPLRRFIPGRRKFSTVKNVTRDR